MQGVILLLFAKYYHLPFLRDVQTDCTRTGLGGYWVSEEVIGAGSPKGPALLVPRPPALARSPSCAPPLTLRPASHQPRPPPSSIF